MKEDNIDNRIERAINSVASKKAAMAQWEKEYLEMYTRKKAAAKRMRIYGFSAAASVILLISIGFGVYYHKTDSAMSDNPNFSGIVYRGGSADMEVIANLINEKNYVEALAKINVLMADTVTDPDMLPERRNYLREVQSVRQYELEWFKINVLVNLDKYDEAINLLTEYVKKEGQYQADARLLLEKLKK